MVKMNKKGYLRILEAIIAIIIIFSFVLVILPKRDVNLIKFDPELESTAESIAKQLQNNKEFRDLILVDNNAIAARNSYSYINTNIRPRTATWNYAIKIADVNINGAETNQAYALSATESALITNPNDNPYINLLNTIKTDVYTKNIIITVPDITTGAPPASFNQNTKKIVRILFWSKQ